MDDLVNLIDEVRLLEHRLVQVVEALHGTEVSVSGRGVLEFLHRHGHTTVPDLARARLVSRQHIQTLMDRLEVQGLVEPVANPAHRRSPHFRLTDAGRHTIVAMRQRESAAMVKGFVASGLTADQLASASGVLRAVRQALDGVVGGGPTDP